MEELTLLAYTVSGLGTVAIVYWLVEHAHRAELLVTGRARFLATGAIWLALTALFAGADGFARPLWQYVLAWFGGWVATMLFKSGVKDNERKDDEAPAPPQE